MNCNANANFSIPNKLSSCLDKYSTLDEVFYYFFQIRLYVYAFDQRTFTQLIFRKLGVFCPPISVKKFFIDQN